MSGEEKSEFLVSSSADGRISQWTIRKGFECTGRLRFITAFIRIKITYFIIFNYL